LAERPIQEIAGLLRMDRQIAGPHVEQMQRMVTRRRRRRVPRPGSVRPPKGGTAASAV
jgi:hypothetical protein